MTWLLYSAMAWRVGLRAEDLGAAGDFLLVRGGLVAAAVLAFVGGLVMPSSAGDWLERGREGDLLPFHSVFLAAQVVFVLLVIGGTYASASFISQTFHLGLPKLSKWCLAFAVGVLLFFVNGGLVLRGVGYEAANKDGPGLRADVSVRHLLGSLVLALVVAAATAFTTGAVVGNRIRGDNETVYPLSIYRVQVFHIASTPGPTGRVATPLDCGLALGGSDDLVRIFSSQSHKVVAYPAAQVAVIRDPVRGASCQSPRTD